MMDSQPLLSSLPGRPSRLQSQQLGMEIWGSGLQALIACLLSPPHTHPFRGPQIFTGLLLQKWQPQGEGGRAQNLLKEKRPRVNRSAQRGSQKPRV